MSEREPAPHEPTLPLSDAGSDPRPTDSDPQPSRSDEPPMGSGSRTTDSGSQPTDPWSASAPHLSDPSSAPPAAEQYSLPASPAGPYPPAAPPNAPAPAAAYPPPGPAPYPPPGSGQPYPISGGGAAPTDGPVIAQIGELAVTSSTVHTPAGPIPLRGSTWQVSDQWMTVQKIPAWAIVLAIVGFCVVGPFSLLVLLVKEAVYQGVVHITVSNGPQQYVSRIPVTNQGQVHYINQQVNYVRSLAAL